MNTENKLTVSTVVWKTFCFVIISFVVLVSLFPFTWLLLSSLKSNADVLSGSFWITDGIHFENYLKAIQNSPIPQFFGNSVFIAAAATGLNLTVASMAAYVVERYDFKGKALIRLAFASILVIPAVALMQPLFQTITTFGLYDTKLGLIIVYSGLGLATSFFIMSSYYKTIPKTLDEAAAIDGAGFFQTFVRIILPLSRPCLATAGVMQFILCWNEFTFALTFTSGNKARTLPIALRYFMDQFGSDYGAMFAATVIVALPSIVLFILFQRQVIEGLTAGSVKG
jgi:raffinose/stachyose/melibiose transport system permease protein